MDFSPLLISIKVALLATGITFILGLSAAWGVVHMKRGKGVVDGIATLPMVLPPTVVGFFLLLIFGKNSLLGGVLEKLQLPFTFTWGAAVAAAVVVSFPLMYRTARGAFEQLNPDYIYAGQTLGLSGFRIFVKIVIPNTRASILAGTILTFARALGEFGATIMVAGNIPGRTQTMAVAVYSAVQSGNRELAYKWAAVILAISFLSMVSMNQIGKRERRV